ncbi:hypothetical protein [Pseudoxanthomonas putridarboris]|uniref:Nucleotidyltransferase family protein n=1 Tax=Pseudoxanthomonas putridarboris TaxID=752605 RepID=A0ABU9IZN2_9GAMM
MTPTGTLHDALRTALPVIVDTFHEPWWIIGSAAMALSGVPGVVPHDIDVLCSVRDADALRATWSRHLDAGYTPRDEARFRSRFACFIHLPMPLEAMGGLEVMTGAGWRPVRVAAATHVRIAGTEVPMPTLDEQRRILHLFGRDKDLAKAVMLDHFTKDAPHVA